jgi:DNA adenine methylase
MALTVDIPITTPSRPVMRYHGGKFRIAPWIIAHMPACRTYVEPYGGAGSILMQKPRSPMEVYNDLDDDIVNVFRVLRDVAQAAELERVLRLTPYSRTEFLAAYDNCIEQTKPNDVSVERARRVIVKSFMSIGTDAQSRGQQLSKPGTMDIKLPQPLISFNKSSKVKAICGMRSNYSCDRNTTPAHDWSQWPNVIPQFHARFSRVIIECRPAIQVMKQFDKRDTLHYVDPPYVFASRSTKNLYHGYKHEMTDQQHRELAEWLHSAKGMVMLSGYHSVLYDELYANWHRIERAALADGARKRTEVLWFNKAAEERLPQPRLL